MNPDFVAQSQPSTVLSGIVAWNIGPSTRAALVTTAIGGDYFNDFLRFSFPYWEKYAETHGIGIIALTDLNAFGRDTRGMNGAWLKLLAPEVVALHFPKVERLALVDTDVIMSPSAPDIFGAAPDNQIAVVSEYENLPYPLVDVKKRMAFLRKEFYSADYPLDSILFASAEQLFEMEGLPSHSNYFCSGLIVVPQSKWRLLAAWFDEGALRSSKLAVAWEQTFVAHKVLENGCYWLPYDFQAIWNREMAESYPSLYAHGDLSENQFAQAAVADVLSKRHFLHFAGSWTESTAWRNNPSQVIGRLTGLHHESFSRYRETAVSGKPRGKVTPGDR